MPYDENLAQRLREIFIKQPDIDEKKMFGGVGFLLHGNMACGVYKDDLIVRVGADQHEAALKRAHTKVFDITGRAMKGWIMVEPSSLSSDLDLEMWVQKGIDYALSLPPK